MTPRQMGIPAGWCREEVDIKGIIEYIKNPNLRALRKIVIAIDGPAASGKSTTARLVAERLKYLHIDTGAMYRAVTLRVLDEGVPLTDAERIRELAESISIRLEMAEVGNRVILDGRDVTDKIRSERVTRSVSQVSSYQPVRDVLVREQRRIASQGGVVLEGRDIGTVVLPDADLKIFMVAGVAERVQRRRLDLERAGERIELAELKQEILERDRRDSTRQSSPLRRAEGAREVDTSTMTIEQQVQYVLNLAKEIIEG